MNRFLHGTARAFAENFHLPEPIIEVGSYQVAGQEEAVNLRPLFPNRAFCGVDMRPGPGVDVVGSVEDLPFPTSSVGTVIALSTFEHVARFWRGFDEVYRVLRPDGAFLVACPFYFHIHDYPSDYWRFTPEALRLLLEPYAQSLIGWHGPKTRPLNVWALAVRERHPGLDPKAVFGYREAMARYAREPLPLGRRLRYWLARLVCGRRPLAPWLDRERWDFECHASANPETNPHLEERQPCIREAGPSQVVSRQGLLRRAWSAGSGAGGPPSRCASPTGTAGDTCGPVSGH